MSLMDQWPYVYMGFKHTNAWTTISPAKVQYPQISQPQISSCPEATSQTVPHSPSCRYLSDAPAPFQNKSQNNKNWTFCVEHEHFSQDICLTTDLGWTLTKKWKSTNFQQKVVWEESDEWVILRLRVAAWVSWSIWRWSIWRATLGVKSQAEAVSCYEREDSV